MQLHSQGGCPNTKPHGSQIVHDYLIWLVLEPHACTYTHTLTLYSSTLIMAEEFRATYIVLSHMHTASFFLKNSSKPVTSSSQIFSYLSK